MSLVIGFILMIGATVAANLFLKAGAMSAPADRVIFGLLDWKAALGIAFFGAAGVIYTWVLHWVPLNVAQSIAAAQFVAVIVASAIVLGEPVPALRLFGIALIACGIIVVSVTWTPAAHGEAVAPGTTKTVPQRHNEAP